MGKSTRKGVQGKKSKPKCCGKFRKKGTHCSRCPVIFREACKLDTERSEMGKEKEEKKRAGKKAEKVLTKKKGKNKDKKVDKKKGKNKDKKVDKKKGKNKE